MKLFAILVSLIVVASSHAGSVSTFSDLRDELVSRASVLTGSVDKVEQKQGKTCLKVIATIDKSTTLGSDIKAGSKIAKSLMKAFPNEFVSTFAAVLPNNLQTLLNGSYSNMVDAVQAILDALQTSIDNLAPGTAKTQAQAALDAAIAAINNALNSAGYSTISKLLASSLKSAATAQKIVTSAGGGGGGTDVFEADVTIGGGTTDHFVATLLGEPNYTVGTSTLDLNGSRGTFIQGDDVTAALCGNFNGTAGTYALGCAGGYFQYGTPNASYSMVTGTLYIATFQNHGTFATTSGTFAFTGSDGSTTTVVTNGVFDLHNVLIFP